MLLLAKTMKVFFKQNKNELIYLIPLGLTLVYLFWKSLSFPLHDFSNSYFPAHLAINNSQPEQILFDIYNFNQYIWELGYEDVLADFYLNSPFNSTFFYPFALIENAHVAKSVFNSLSILLFIISTYVLFRRFGEKVKWLIIAIPVLFFIPLRNQIFFGQTYFLVFALVVLSYVFFEKNKNTFGGSLLVTAVMLKVFPVIYGFPLLFKKQWRAILLAVVIVIISLLVSLMISGTSIWETYIFDVTPNAIKNKSAVNFQYNAQSMDVFLKTVFVKDSYYNPSAIFDNEQLYYTLKWIYKSVIIGVAISFSFSYKNKLFALLSIWVVALFLIQSRTATYAQILWLIPAFYVIYLSISFYKKAGFLIVLFLVCNIPIPNLELLPLVFKFSRLWLSIILAMLFYFSLKKRVNYGCVLLGFLMLLPLHLDMFSKPKVSNSEYVLNQKNHFMIFDFNVKDDVLVYNALGKNGNEFVFTEIPIDSFDENSCSIINNQIVLNGKQITNTPALKKKPVLVNNCEVFYLTDSKSRRGAFTIKKVNICNTF